MSLDPEVGEVLRGERRWWVVEGDCLEVLPLLPVRSCAHVITDPPYEAEAHTLGRRRTEAGQIEAVDLAFPPIRDDERRDASSQFARVAARWILVFCQVEAVAAWRQVLLDGGSRWWRGQAWIKPDSSPQFNGCGPAQGFECIATAHSMAAYRWNGGGRRGVYVHDCHRTAADDAGHQTQKPLPLMLELVGLFTDPGDLVLDPFAGSGTTGVACLRLGRRFLGVEKSPKYCALARERLEAESKGLTLRDARHGQLPLLST